MDERIPTLRGDLQQRAESAGSRARGRSDRGVSSRAGALARQRDRERRKRREEHSGLRNPSTGRGGAPTPPLCLSQRRSRSARHAASSYAPAWALSDQSDSGQAAPSTRPSSHLPMSATRQWLIWSPCGSLSLRGGFAAFWPGNRDPNERQACPSTCSLMLETTSQSAGAPDARGRIRRPVSAAHPLTAYSAPAVPKRRVVICQWGCPPRQCGDDLDRVGCRRGREGHGWRVGKTSDEDHRRARSLRAAGHARGKGT